MASPKTARILKWMRDGLVMLAVTAGLFVAAEIVIRLAAPQDSVTTFENDSSLAIEDPVLGHVYRPNSGAATKTPEFTVEFKINQDGLRDETAHPDPKPEGVTRILLLGDSFTFGDANDYDKIWPVVFERELLQKGLAVDVVKAGVSGYDTQKEFLYLKRLFSKYKPDIVVLTFLPNDLFTNQPLPAEGTRAEAPSPGTAGHVVRTRNFKKTRLHVITFAKRLMLPRDFLYTRLYLMTARAEYFTTPLSERLTRQVDVTKNILTSANDYCRDRNVEFVVFSLPQLFQVLMKANEFQVENLDIDFVDAYFDEFAAASGFQWIAALPALAREYRTGKKDLYYRFDGHFNNRGNELVGRLLANRFVPVIEAINERDEAGH